MFRRLTLFLCLSFLVPYGICQTPLPDNSPFDKALLQQMHDQLLKLQGLLLQTLPDYETQVKDLKATVAEEQSNRERAVAAEQLATKAAQVERDSYKAQMEFYQSALKAVTKPCGGARKFFHYATLGIVACH